MVEAALSIIKCSRGSVNVALGACECVGALAEKEDEEQSSSASSSSISRKGANSDENDVLPHTVKIKNRVTGSIVFSEHTLDPLPARN